MRFRLERGWRHYQAGDGLLTVGKIADNVLEIVKPAQDRGIADQLTAIGPRRRQQTNRPQSLNRTIFDAPQQDFDISSTTYQQGRRSVFLSSMTQRPGITEITIGETGGAQEKHLQQPIKDDGNLAEKERAVNVRSDKNIIK